MMYHLGIGITGTVYAGTVRELKMRMKYLDKIGVWVCMDCDYEEE